MSCPYPVGAAASQFHRKIHFQRTANNPAKRCIPSRISRREPPRPWLLSETKGRNLRFAMKTPSSPSRKLQENEPFSAPADSVRLWSSSCITSSGRLCLGDRENGVTIFSPALSPWLESCAGPQISRSRLTVRPHYGAWQNYSPALRQCAFRFW
jgi:hypothetical protein